MPISNLSQPIQQALQRRAMGQNVGSVSEVNPPTSRGPSTVATPPASIGGARTPTPAGQGPQTGAVGANGIGGISKEANDTRIIEAMLTYLRRKVL